MKPYKSANALVWGAILAVIVGLFAVLGELVGSSKPDNLLIATPAKAAGTSFALGYIVALVRNWINERHL